MRRRWSRWGAAVVCLGALGGAACFEDIPDPEGEPTTGPAASTGAEGTSTGGDTGTRDGTTFMFTGAADSETGPNESDGPDTAGTSTGAPVECEPTQSCAAVPPMWEGPYRIVPGQAGPPPMCPAGDEVAFGGRPPLTADPIDCVCEPGAPACPMVVLAVTSGFANCAATDKEILVFVGSSSCTDIFLTEGYFGLDSPASGCPATSAVGEPSPVAWAESYRVCDPPGPEACDGGVCVEPGACIVRAGEHACPPGEFSEQRVIFTEVADDRGCAPCSAAPNCGDVEYFDDSGCSGEPSVTLPIVGGDACMPDFDVDIPPESVRWGGELSCAIVEDTAPTGSAMPAAPLTVCCGPS